MINLAAFGIWAFNKRESMLTYKGREQTENNTADPGGGIIG